MPDQDMLDLFLVRAPKARRGLRWWLRTQFFRFAWGGRLASRWGRWYARLAPVPEPKCQPPQRFEEMGFSIYLWEEGTHRAPHIFLPGTNVEILLHPYCNRVIGVRVFD